MKNFLGIVLSLALAFSLPASGYVQLSPVTGGYVVTLTDAPTIAWDVAQGYAFKVTLGGNRTMGTPTGATEGTIVTLQVHQDGTGNRTLTFTPETVKFPGGALPPSFLSTAAGAMDVVTFYVDSEGDLVYTGHQKGLAALPATPDAPSGFTATLNGDNMDFAWTDNSSNESAFLIELENPPGVWSGIFGPAANAVSFSEPAATLGTGTWNFRIKAVNGAVESAASNEDDLTVP